MTEQPAPTSPEDAQVEVVDNPDRHRFDIRVGGKRAGFSMYRDVDDITNAPQRIFFHTVIGDEFGGQGLASTLTRDALAQTIAAGRRIVPVSPTWRSGCPATTTSRATSTRCCPPTSPRCAEDPCAEERAADGGEPSPAARSCPLGRTHSAGASSPSVSLSASVEEGWVQIPSRS